MQQSTEPLVNDPKREAWTAMRAYDFQVLHTIRAWLCLEDDEVLYIEGAEDFDRVKGVDAETVQIKASERSISLRTDSVIEMLNNYWLHRKRNPGKRVTAKYIATADVLAERGDPLGEGLPGICVWEQTKSDANEVIRLRRATKIGAFLCEIHTLSDDLKTFLKRATPESILAQLILPMTWQTSAESSEKVIEDICDYLILHGNQKQVPAERAARTAVGFHWEVWRASSKSHDRALTRADFLRLFDKYSNPLLSQAELEALIRQGKPEDADVPSPAYLAPRLPDHAIPRHQLVEELKRALLNSSQPSPSRAECAAIIGMPGVGKSMLAALFANEPEVIDAFPDGVFWATLGQQPNIGSILESWARLLGAGTFGLASRESLVSVLRSKFASRKCLIVIDDAWSPDHIEQLRVEGNACAVIVTTRDAQVGRTLTSRLVQVDVLEPEEALELFARRIGRPLNASEKLQSEKLVKVLEFLPLAIAISAAQSADGMPIESLCSALEREVARLDMLDLDGLGNGSGEDAYRKSRSVEASFALSLREMNSDLQLAFAWLGALAEDATFNATIVRTVWGLENHLDAEYRLMYLRRLALVQSASDASSSGSRYRMHDLLHDYARRLLTAPTDDLYRRIEIPAMGLSMAAVHNTLLNRYRDRSAAQHWSELRDDGYIRQHLAYHLEHADRAQDLYDLFACTDSSGANTWLTVREKSGELAGYVSDLERLRRLSVAASASTPSALSHAVLATLLQSSLVSRAGSIDDALAVAAVRTGLWAPHQGLTWARLSTAGELRRISNLVALLPHLGNLTDEKLLEEVFVEATSALSGPGLTSVLGVENRVLEMLMPSLSDQYKQRLVSMSAVAPLPTRARMAVQMAPHLPELALQSFVRQIISECGKDGSETEQQKLMALLELAKIGKVQTLDVWPYGLFDRCFRSKDPKFMCDFLFAIAPYLSAKDQAFMLQFLSGLARPELATDVLRSMASNLVSAHRDAAVALVRPHPNLITRYWTIAAIASGSKDSTELFTESVDELVAQPPSWHKFQALSNLLTLAPVEARASVEVAAIQSGHAAGFGSLGSGPLQRFVAILSRPGLDRAMDLARAQGSVSDKAAVLSALLACVEEHRVEALCGELLSVLSSGAISADFPAFAHRLQKEFVSKFIEVQTRINDQGAIASVVAASIEFSGGVNTEDIASHVRALHVGAGKAERAAIAVNAQPRGLLVLARSEIEELIAETMSEMTSMGYVSLGGEAIAARLQGLLLLLDEPARTSKIAGLLSAEFRTMSVYLLPACLAVLVVIASTALTDTLMGEVRRVLDPRHRARLYALRALVDEDQRDPLMRQALREAIQLDEYLRIGWLEDWAALTPRSVSAEVLQIATSFKRADLPARARWITMHLRSRHERRKFDVESGKLTVQALTALRTGIIQPYLISTLSSRQWRSVVYAWKDDPRFATFVLCLRMSEAGDLYELALKNLPAKCPQGVEKVRWLSFGIAASALSADVLRAWIADDLEAMAKSSRSTALDRIEFMLPILNSLGGWVLVRDSMQAVLDVQKWQS